MPSLFEVVPQSQDGSEHLPKADVPYYAFFQDGLFLHKQTQIGSVLVKETSMPKHIGLGTLGHPNGLFTWTGANIPAEITGSALKFFRRIYEKHGTEAEVLLTMHNDTGKIRIFVPYQRVSGGGVKSVYEPTHIDPAYTVVGTIHSHCMMTAFHSGTDSNDASDMDGVHITIGMVMNTPPQVVAMVSMNGKEFHYNKVEDILDIDWDAGDAPDYWDKYVYPASTESQKPKGLKTITQKMWDEFRGLATPKPKYTSSYTPTKSTWTPRDPLSKSKYSVMDQTNKSIQKWTPLKESETFNYRRAHKMTIWDDEGQPIQFHQTMEDLAIDMAIDHAVKEHLITSYDWARVPAAQADDIDFWLDHFTAKLGLMAEVLELLGARVDYAISDAEDNTP